ncbi:MAG: argininosuccinate lyase [Saprospiraceae bacterium]|nr:argininosuccinate lyase [Saprospiraceae bacterium]
MTKLWDKGISVNEHVARFTVGRDPELDHRLATYDIMGSMAHCRMLVKTGIMSDSDGQILGQALAALLSQAREGKIVIEDDVEDIHSQVELMLTTELGDVGKKIHAARSRNDQILLDLRLYLRDVIKDIVEDTQTLVEKLLLLSDRYATVLLPGYTHLQAAMPSSFGLWFGAYAETLIDDLEQWLAAFNIINQNPLGSAAGYGSSLPIDRGMTTELLGFADLNYNVVHAQMGRGKSEQSLGFAIAGQAMTMSRFAMDVCLYNSQNFGFIKLSDSFTTGSSIMPHKKNPDVFELIRGHSNQLQQLPGQISGMIGTLPSGYHREYQLLKPLLFDAIDAFTACQDMLLAALDHITVQEDIMLDTRYDLVFSVERVNQLVMQGTPFRDAYRRVAAEIKDGSFTPDRNLQHTHEGSVGQLCNEQIRSKLELRLSRFDFSYTKALMDLIEV